MQYAATVALNSKEIESHPERVSNILPFINKYNWEGINYPSKANDWKRFEENNPIIALNILFTKKIGILPAYISNHNSVREKQIIFLMIPNKEKEGWHYLAVKSLTALLRRITSKHHCNFHCLNCLQSCRTENRFISHEKVCKNEDFCGIAMRSEKDKILKFKQYMKSSKIPYIIYAGIESSIRKINGCENNPETSSTKNIVEHIPCGYLIQQFGDWIT